MPWDAGQGCRCVQPEPNGLAEGIARDAPFIGDRSHDRHATRFPVGGRVGAEVRLVHCGIVHLCAEGLLLEVQIQHDGRDAPFDRVRDQLAREQHGVFEPTHRRRPAQRIGDEVAGSPRRRRVDLNPVAHDPHGCSLPSGRHEQTWRAPASGPSCGRSGSSEPDEPASAAFTAAVLCRLGAVWSICSRGVWSMVSDATRAPLEEPERK